MTDQDVCPIIYVRGFAGGTSGIDSATDDPFYGLNAGATHVRIDGNGNPQFYQFEGPLVRLIEDEDYRIVAHGGQQAYLDVLGASRAFVHRSHSGSYGEVNFEEGYQNLRSFLFGARKATAATAVSRS
jgi:hypothetical protein